MSEPINLVVPNTAEQKMDAIVAVAHAIENVSKALVSVQIDVTISNNTIKNTETAISINTEEKL